MKSLAAVIALFVSFCVRPDAGNTGRIAQTADKEVVCFIYHRVGDSRYPSTNTSIQDFEAHLKYLSQNNFTVLNFSEALEYLQSGQSDKKVAVITVDDGYSSFFRNGLPLLQKYKLPATLFINTKTVGGGDYMDWNDLRVAMENRVEIGNHTHSHDFFLNQPEATRYKTFKQEIELCQQLIEKNLGVVPKVFSFPYGEFDSRMKAIAEEAGFTAAAAQKSGVWYNGMDLFQCPRFPMSESYSALAKFKEKANMRALRVSSMDPQEYIKPKSNQPLLTLEFDPADLRLDQMQCFVQGAECKLNLVDRTKATVTIQASKSIAGRRRTIYTLTVPDKKGKWHWYSHLWINAIVKE